jgi:hypothetical protein
MARSSTSLHPEHAAEQAFIEKVHHAEELARVRAERSPEFAGDRYAARTARQQMLERLKEPIDLDALVIGRIDLERGQTYYLGRGAVHDEDSGLLVINWRMPVASAFYTANRRDPQGLARRRRFQLDQLRLLGIVDEDFGVRPASIARVAAPEPVDEVVGSQVAPRVVDDDSREALSRTPPAEAVPQPEVADPPASPQIAPNGVDDDFGQAPAKALPMDAAPEVLDPGASDQGPPQVVDAILADMDRARGTEMRDIVATIEARQYELISDSIDGVLVIQGGPGSGKTAIALHRAAWLLFNHRDELERSGVLVVGPNRAFMEYVSQVLPTLGENSVVQSAIDRLPELGDVRVRDTDDAEITRLKGDIRMAAVIQHGVIARVRAPAADVILTIGRTRAVLPANRIAELIEEVWRRGFNYLAGRDVFRRALVAFAQEQAAAATARFRSGPAPTDVEMAVVGPGGPLERIWPTVTAPEVIRDLLSSRQRLAGAGPSLSEEERAALRRGRARSIREEPWTAADIPLLDEADAALRGVTSSYGYVLVDEAQDMSPMQLRMVLRRSSTGRATLVGDIAQATGSTRFADWLDLFDAAAVDAEPRIAELAIGYRVPQQIIELAAQLLPRIAPEIVVPAAVREGPEEPRLLSVSGGDVPSTLVAEVANRVEGNRTVGVIAPADELGRVRAVLTEAGIQAGDVLNDGLGRQVTVLSAEQAKGLEFDHVVVVEPARIAGRDGDWAYVYIALTRATRTLSVVYSTPEPFEIPPPEAHTRPDVEVAPMMLEDVPPVPAAQTGTVLGARYTEALMQAKFLHAGQHRRGTFVPYLAHLQAVAALVLEDGGSEDEAIAALLHDAVEDTGPQLLDQIVDQFGVTVARIVAGCTDPVGDAEASWRDCKVEHLRELESAGPHVRRVALAEKLDNARSLVRDYRRVGERLWTRMEVDPEDLLWYYAALADLFVTERPGDLASEFQHTVETLLEIASQREPVA